MAPGWGGGGLNAIYWYQIFVLISAVVGVQEMFSSHGSLLAYTRYHHGEKNQIKSAHYDERKKRAHDSQIVRANSSPFILLLLNTTIV